MSIKAYLVEECSKAQVFLIRSCGSHRPCAVRPGKLHRARVGVGVVELDDSEDGFWKVKAGQTMPSLRDGDPQWPTACECGYPFEHADEWAISQDRIYRRADTGEEKLLREWGPGAIWEAKWMRGMYGEQDGGRVYEAICPGGEQWTIDSRASNCDSPCANCGQPFHTHKGKACTNYVDARPHRCWVRTGTAPDFDVGKGGVTCGAGAGSIQTSNWHGFLRHGYFVE